MTPLPPTPLVAPAPVPLWRQVYAAVWARRWKIAAVVALAALNRLCDLLPAKLEPLCDVLAKVGALFGGAG